MVHFKAHGIQRVAVAYVLDQEASGQTVITDSGVVFNFRRDPGAVFPKVFFVFRLYRYGFDDKKVTIGRTIGQVQLQGPISIDEIFRDVTFAVFFHLNFIQIGHHRIGVIAQRIDLRRYQLGCGCRLKCLFLALQCPQARSKFHVGQHVANAILPVGLTTPRVACSVFMCEGEKCCFEPFASRSVKNACRGVRPSDQRIRGGATNQGHGQLRRVCRKIDFLHNTIAESLAATEEQSHASKKEERGEVFSIHGIKILHAMQWMG